MPASTARPRSVPRSAPTLTPYEEYRTRFSNGEKGNLIHGRAILEMSSNYGHEQLFRLLYFVLTGYASAKDLGEVLGSRTLVKIDEQSGFEPDVLFIRNDRLSILTEQDVQGAPDLAVEIVSPSSRKDDRGPKFDGYERLGVPEYWLIDPERREADFFRLEDTDSGPRYRAAPLSGGVFESAAVPGFRLDPQLLFQDPLPSEFEMLQRLLGDEA
ncbi:MAG: Uma2 family endonuclease [Bacteroidota bacterium]